MKRAALIGVALLSGSIAGGAFAQATDTKADPKPETKSDVGSRTSTVTSTAPATTMHPGAATLLKMSGGITIEFTGNKLEDVLKFIRDASGVQMEILWIDDRNSTGLDKEAEITLSARNLTFLELLEKVLDKATNKTSGQTATWQLIDGGTLQIGTRDRLNAGKRLVVYDINDLLFDIRDKTNAPTFDIQSAFQAGGGGGGGGQSPIQQQNQNQNDLSPTRREDKAKEIIRLITSLVETDQWQDNGGEGGSITYWQGTLLINAADYMHRQIDGYDFWPKTNPTPPGAGGGRYLTMDSTLQNVGPVKFRNYQVPAIVGGR